MRNKLGYLMKVTLSACLLTIGSLWLLLVALATACMLRNFYSAVVLKQIGKIILKIWSIQVVVAPALLEPFSKRQVIYIFNHSSTIDLFVLIALGLPHTRFFLSGYLRNVLPIGLIGYLVRVIWTVPQNFPEKRTIIFQRAEEILRKTRDSVLLSPEGKRVTTGKIGHFNKGAFHLATALQAPIVPLYIKIPKAIDPGTGWHAQPGCVHVHVHPAIPTQDWELKDLLRNKDAIKSHYEQWHAQHHAQ
jgi:1-acyl-sn-glycerol-3-phosphate acyltransferase